MKCWRVTGNYGTFEITRVVEADTEDGAMAAVGIVGTLEFEGWTFTEGPDGEEWTIEEVPPVTGIGTKYQSEEVERLAFEAGWPLWGLFGCSGSSWPARHQLQRDDTPEVAGDDGEMIDLEPLEDDVDAWKLCVFGAMHGDVRCMAALAFLAIDSPVEHEAIIRFCLTNNIATYDAWLKTINEESEED